jgi:hypothetical protein
LQVEDPRAGEAARESPAAALERASSAAFWAEATALLAENPPTATAADAQMAGAMRALGGVWS